MRIEFLELSNFRKLVAVRIDLARTTSLFVGANNSGKTSAMLALRYFLKDRGGFSTNDFTASHWRAINDVGVRWESGEDPPPSLKEWVSLLPTLDVWLHVEDGEFHRVSKLIPTLDWAGGRLGVRLRLEPDKIESLYKDYLESAKAAKSVSDAAAEAQDAAEPLEVWPVNMLDFLRRKLRKTKLDTHFIIRAYLLDPDQVKDPERGQAQPQTLPDDAVGETSDPFAGLIRIDDISAQRGFGRENEKGNVGETEGRRGDRRLSRQLRRYFGRHLDPTENPELEDLQALQAIAKAQNIFDARLKVSFDPALSEVQKLGYPGITDPKLTVSTRLRPTDGLNHDAAVQYELASGPNPDDTPLRLPEDFNGLGYQNLISMVFLLMSFRDGWMRVGKKKTGSGDEAATLEPLHLVLVEEPEVHLHAQVQQVFIRKAHEILRNHDDLRESKLHTTQLLVSTHSSHVAHEVAYSSLRYFRRMPKSEHQSVPFSAVVNLSTVFGEGDNTARFVTRYLRARHCDLFFADAAILVEGAAERMLVPHFIRLAENRYLAQCYVTLLEIGGSHAFRLRDLIEALGLPTLVISDLDAAIGEQGKQPTKTRPARDQGQVTLNPTLKKWIPKLTKIDDLMDTSGSAKEHQLREDHMYAARVAYPTAIPFEASPGTEVIPYTFEDALVLANLDFFSDESLDGGSLLKKVQQAVRSHQDHPNELSKALFKAICKGDKAEFVLDVLFLASDGQLSDLGFPSQGTTIEGKPSAQGSNAPEPMGGQQYLKAPTYIAEGLQWLGDRLRECKREVLQTGDNSVGDT